MSSTDSNWDEYYSKSEFKVPEFIINALWKSYLEAISRHLDTRDAGLTVIELGGADSCFYERFKEAFPVSEYHIVDNNQLGLDLFPHKQEKGVFLHNVDLLNARPEELGVCGDIVFSAGLIEHFVPLDTRRIIEFHFGLACSGGMVLMSFPTPTWIYWAFRRFLERTGKFPPLFERPILEDEVMRVLTTLGVPLESYKIWNTILTQLLTLTRKLSAS